MLVVAFIARPVSATGAPVHQVTRGLFISIMVGAVGARGVQPSGLSPLPPLRRHTSYFEPHVHALISTPNLSLILCSPVSEPTPSVLGNRGGGTVEFL